MGIACVGKGSSQDTAASARAGTDQRPGRVLGPAAFNSGIQGTAAPTARGWGRVSRRAISASKRGTSTLRTTV